MENINIYGIETNEAIIDKIKDIDSKIVEEKNKPLEEMDKERIFQLRYQQFIQGLKLQTLR